VKTTDVPLKSETYILFWLNGQKGLLFSRLMTESSAVLTSTPTKIVINAKGRRRG